MPTAALMSYAMSVLAVPMANPCRRTWGPQNAGLLDAVGVSRIFSEGESNGYRNVKVNARVVLNTLQGKEKHRLKHTSEWDMLVRWKVSHIYLVFEESQMYRMYILCMIKGITRIL